MHTAYTIIHKCLYIYKEQNKQYGIAISDIKIA